MSEHYYTRKPQTDSDKRTITVTLRGRTFTFATDSGVFSKSGVDYGSRLLIETIDIGREERVLDVGCGYGPIGLCAAVLANEGLVTMIDVNERAVALAKENAARNGIGNVSVRQSDLFASVEGERFTTVLTNPPIRAGKDVVHRIFEKAAESLLPGGSLWVVIQKKQGAPSAYAKLNLLFDEVEEICKDKGYRIYRAVKPAEPDLE